MLLFSSWYDTAVNQINFFLFKPEMNFKMMRAEKCVSVVSNSVLFSILFLVERMSKESKELNIVQQKEKERGRETTELNRSIIFLIHSHHAFNQCISAHLFFSFPKLWVWECSWLVIFLYSLSRLVGMARTFLTVLWQIIF